MSLPARLLTGLLLLAGPGALAQVPADSALAGRQVAPLADTLAVAAPESAAETVKAGQVMAALGLAIGAGLLVFLLYNVRSR